MCEDEVSEGNLKRPPPPPPPEQGEERSKRRNVDREDSGDGDEDWLRYSPPPVVEVVAEKTISRFASDIRGDCMSVTAPNGERVYAKVATDGLDGGGIGGTRQRTRISKPNFNYKGQLLSVLLFCAFKYLLRTNTHSTNIFDSPLYCFRLLSFCRASLRILSFADKSC